MINPNTNNDDSIDFQRQEAISVAANPCTKQHHRQHLNAVSSLANGINRIAVNYSNSKQLCENNVETNCYKIMPPRELAIQANTDDGDDDVDGMVGALRSEQCVADGGGGGSGMKGMVNASSLLTTNRNFTAACASATTPVPWDHTSALLASRSSSHDYGAAGSGTMDALRPTESDDCDRSQQSSSGARSFRSRAGRKTYSPRWMDCKSGEGGDDGTCNDHHQQQQHDHPHRNNHSYQHIMSSSSADGGYASLTDDNATHHHHRHQHAASVDLSSVSVVERKRSRNREGSFSSRSDKVSTDAQQYHHYHHHHQEYCAKSQAWSSSTRTDTTAHDSHEEGYVSSTAEGGYHSGGGSHSISVGVRGYHSFHHPELSFAASVKSDIATGKRERMWYGVSSRISLIHYLSSSQLTRLLVSFLLVCSGSVVEDIDMTEEIASVASDSRKGAILPHNTKGLEFASNILNDVGPPQSLCSALLLAANAACFIDERTAPDSDAVSDVVAHLDTVSLHVLRIRRLLNL